MRSLVDMRPSFAQGDVGDTHSTYAEHLCNLRFIEAALGMQSSDLLNVGVCERGEVMLRTAHFVEDVRRNPTSLSQHISGVVGVCSKEEMLWSDARWIVASVTDDQSVGDLTEVQFPGETVSRDMTVVQGQPSVPSPTCFLEVPAIIRFENAAPKTFFERPEPSFVSTRLATEPRLPLPPFPWIGTKFVTAMFAMRQGGYEHKPNIAQASERTQDPATGVIA